MALPPFNPSDLSFALLNPPQNPNPNPNPLLSVSKSHSPPWRLGRRGNPRLSTAVSLKATRSGSKYAVLGAGFAGLSVAWHLLKNSRKGCDVQVDVFDENGIGGGASGVAGGLLHPYSPKAKLLWKGAEFWKECLELLAVAEQANSAQIKEGSANADGIDGSIILRRGILRPATSRKNVEILMENARSCLEGCTLETLDEKAAQSLIPGLCAPFDLAIYMPLAISIHPKRYLQALFSACQNLAYNESKRNSNERVINLRMQHVSSLQRLSGEYDSVIVCLGARVNSIPELIGKLPLRTCRGIVAELNLPSSASGEYGNQSPSILSDAWLAFQGSRTVCMGSTWDWNSNNFDQNVSKEEATRATEELVSKASVFYPEIAKWSFVGAKAGLRAMPPLTENGSVPLMGCLNDLIGDKSGCMFWLVGGLGARGLLYHGLVGKLTSQAVISCDESVIPPEFIDWKRKSLCIVN